MVSSVDDARALPSYTVQQNRSIETGAARAKDQITAVLPALIKNFYSGSLHSPIIVPLSKLKYLQMIVICVIDKDHGNK